MIRPIACVLGGMLFAGTAHGQNVGYYQGQSILYPYVFVYTDEAAGDGQGYSHDDLYFLPKSAPLPTTEPFCVWVDLKSLGNKNWYQWEPRITPPDKIQFLGPKVCYLEDRGEPKNINDLKRAVP